ncbi:MAG: RES family NAD+ phosphorylase [Parazoarcus communis]
MQVWRIASDTPDYLADDLSGAGAKALGGRWNRPGLPVVYCARSPALACLETLVHLNTSGLPLNRYLVVIDIPDEVWVEREIHTCTSLDVGWDASPPGMVSLNTGGAWLKAQRSAVIELPSAIVPEDSVVLINPQHPHAHRITATKLRRWLYDPRLGSLTR